MPDTPSIVAVVDVVALVVWLLPTICSTTPSSAPNPSLTATHIAVTIAKSRRSSGPRTPPSNPRWGE